MPRRTEATVRMRQTLDWSAAVWAGVIAGVVFLAAAAGVVPLFIGGDPWLVLRLIASLVLGDGALTPDASNMSILVAAIGAHLVLSTGGGIAIAYCIHRGGMITGILGGAVLGAAIYALTIYGLTRWFPQLFALASTPFLVTHIVYGMLAGGIYEGLEVDDETAVAR